MRHKGVTLLEMLVALFIGAVVIAVLMNIYLAIKKTFIIHEANYLLVEAGRSTAFFLSEAIRHAGNTSCIDPTQKNMDRIFIEGFRRHDSRFKGVGTDVIVVVGCNQQQFAKIIFYVGDTSRKNTENQHIFALFKELDQKNRVELVSDVKNITIWYGILKQAHNGDKIIQYTIADQVKDWRLVCNIKILIELISSGPVLSNRLKQHLSYSRKEYYDRYLHKEWLMNVSLRNK